MTLALLSFTNWPVLLSGLSTDCKRLQIIPSSILGPALASWLCKQQFICGAVNLWYTLSQVSNNTVPSWITQILCCVLWCIKSVRFWRVRFGLLFCPILLDCDSLDQESAGYHARTQSSRCHIVNRWKKGMKHDKASISTKQPISFLHSRVSAWSLHCRTPLCGGWVEINKQDDGSL